VSSFEKHGKTRKTGKNKICFYSVFLVFPCFIDEAQQLADTSQANAS
jgi:hypothetical protein